MLSKFFDPKKLIKKFKAQEGFSLTEMVVVVAIIVVLISNLIPYAKLYLRKAYKISDMQEARLIGQTAQLVLLEDKEAYDSWMNSYNDLNWASSNRFDRDGGVGHVGRGSYEYLEDDLVTRTPLKPMYRTHENGNIADRRFFNCVGSASEDPRYRRYADILHRELPLVDIQKTNNRSQFLIASFGCTKKNEYGSYILSSSTTEGHTGKPIYGDSYVITARLDDPLYVEVYISASNAAGASYPLYRVYPDISTTYLSLQ